jgi:ABC-type branched-subunit amino acid transport system substrate-binding protein
MVTDYAPDPTRPAWKSFVSAWKARGTEPPDRLAALGFDAARLAIEGPEMSMNLWQGAQGAVRFRPGQRYNSAATVLRVKNNVFTACPCELP